jgi:glycogen debranching enzyme
MSKPRTNGLNPSLSIDLSQSSSTHDALATPKTPADEGIEFFQSTAQTDTPIRVYELRLDSDGGPNKDASVQSFSMINVVVY